MKLSDNQLNELLDKLIASTKSPHGIYSATESYKKIEKRLFSKRAHTLSVSILAYAAAIALICVLSWSVYQYTKPVEILTTSTLAETKSIQLPDGSKVVLNHFSSLTYPKEFSNKDRIVSLNGEAYFEVSKDKKHPFIVSADAIDVKVLGTHFNVEAYKSNNEIKTTLFEGSVSIKSKDNSSSIILNPNESAIYNKLKKKIIHETGQKVSNEIAWQKGLFIFNNLPLKEITRKLSNSFGVTIQIPDQSLQNYRLTARFNNEESLEQILKLLQTAGEFNYSQDDKLIRITTKLK
ncbi:FecR family protein [Bacteroides ihuae]|uniref:FecR family protein n=1 Tax=Bacteroides ihuae TaxID=1852362 RepID=UPI0008D94609|nr:FecR family protein [Bacteroides ihuae]